MNYKPLVTALLLVAPAVAAPLPDAVEVLKTAMEPPAAAYEGEVRVSAVKSAEKRLRVYFAPPQRYRREIVSESGEMSQLVVSDGQAEWIYDKKLGKVWAGEPADPFYKRLGPDEEFDLLTANYDVLLSTGADIAGRASWKLEIRSRSDARLSRSLWVDRRHGLILKSESFQPDGTSLASMSFSRISFPVKQDPALFKFEAPGGVVAVQRLDSDYMGLEEAKAASGLNPKVPTWLASGYVFESLAIIPYRGKSIIHYRYSDGIHAMSLFQCPPRVRPNFGGKAREKVKLASGSGYLSWSEEGNVLGWSSDRSQFVLIAPLTLEILKRVAESIK